MTGAHPVLELAAPRPAGLLAVDASAGTGKTYALVALAGRALAVGEVTTDELLVVTFMRAAAAELRDRLRRGLVAALAGLDGGDVSDAWIAALTHVPPDERAARADRLRVALTTFDRATVTTLHGYCQTALALAGLRTGATAPRLRTDTSPELRSTLRDLLLARLLAGAPATPADGTPDTVEHHHAATLRVLQSAAGARPAPLGPSEPAAAAADAAFVTEVLAEWRRRLRADGIAGFDELVLGLHAQLHGPTGPEVATVLRRRHRLVLVDEHQDTDAVQWAVLRRAFRDEPGPAAPPPDPVVVGHPTPSIYRSRGADDRAYLAARDEAGATRVLAESHRAAPDLVAGLNVLLRGAALGAGISFDPVAAARPPVDAARGAALQLRWLAPGPDGYPAAWPHPTQAHTLLVPPTRIRILADVVDAVVGALADPVVPDGAGGLRAPAPSEVAVLVRSNADAAAAVAALSAAGVPAAQPRGGSVLEADAVDELRILLAALADPGDERRVRALRTSWFGGAGPHDLDDPDGLAGLQGRLEGWAQELAGWGVLALWARLRSDPEIGMTLATAGERGTTDLEHLAELLHAALHAGGAPAAVALRTLDELRAGGVDDEDGGEDPAVRRLASDGAAVQVLTVHRAKGLEWPVVLLPFGGFGTSVRAPYAFGADAGRVVDAASWQDWRPADDTPEHPDHAHATPSQRKDATGVELRADAARLLYVALTRARERLVVWWAPTPTFRGTELHRLLFGARDVDGTLGGVEPPKLAKLPPAAIADALDALAARVRDAGGTVEVVAVGPEAEGVRYRPAEVGAGVEPAVARLERNLTTAGVGRWSYTRLIDGGAVIAADAPPPETEGGGRDEPTPLQEVGAAGTAFGVVVHRALEAVDPFGDGLEERLRRHLAADPAAAVAGDPDRLAAALAQALATPLDPLLPGLALTGVPARDRVAELRFDLPLTDTQRRIDLAALGATVGEALGDDPLGPSLRALGGRVVEPRIAGWLTGSLDLLVRTRIDGHDSYTVIDHKTNLLRDADRGPAYGAAALRGAVAAGGYALQLLLYLVAAHRFLRWRAPGYDPGRDLGGAGLLFLRGLGGPDAPLRDGARDGVFAWRPDPAVVLLADDLLAGRTP